MSAERQPPDFYKVLNVSRDASPRDITASYRNLARSFHPDHRTTPTSSSDDEPFLQIERAHAVLSSAAHRHAYDKYGHHGVRMLSSSTELAEYVGGTPKPDLQLLTRLLSEERRHERYRAELSAVNTSGSMEMSLSMLNPNRPVLPGVFIAVNVDAPLTPSTTLNFSGEVQDRRGLASSRSTLELTHSRPQASARYSVACTAGPGAASSPLDFAVSKTFGAGTEATSAVVRASFLPAMHLSGAGMCPSLRLESSRTVWNRLSASTSLSFGHVRDLSLNLNLWMQPDRNVLSLSTVSVSCGVDSAKAPHVRISAESDPPPLSRTSAWRSCLPRVRSSVKIGSRGLSLSLSSSRRCGRYSQLTVGVRFEAAKGTRLVFALRRGTFVLNLPIHILPMPLGVLPSLSSVLTAVLLDDVFKRLIAYVIPPPPLAPRPSSSSSPPLSSKSRATALSHQSLMRRVAITKVSLERNLTPNGLVIHNAMYGIRPLLQSVAPGSSPPPSLPSAFPSALSAETALDVTVVLQFFTANSSLVLLSGGSDGGGALSGVLGFHDPWECCETNGDEVLEVTYSFEGRAYRRVFLPEKEDVRLPCVETSVRTTETNV